MPFLQRPQPYGYSPTTERTGKTAIKPANIDLRITGLACSTPRSWSASLSGQEPRATSILANVMRRLMRWKPPVKSSPIEERTMGPSGAGSPSIGPSYRHTIQCEGQQMCVCVDATGADPFWCRDAKNDRTEPLCMYRLLFARVQLHVFRKSLICIRRLDRLIDCRGPVGSTHAPLSHYYQDL